MKAGEYYVGDLCYVFTDDQWSEVCDLMYKWNIVKLCEESVEGVLTLKDGTEFAIFGTLWGDGSYPNNQTFNHHCVDSGTIGCVLKEKCCQKYDHIEDLGEFVTFLNDFEPYSECDPNNRKADSNGKLYFGNTEAGQFIVDTNPTNDEDDYEEEDDYDDE